MTVRSYISFLPGDTGEEIGTKGCLKMNDGEPLKQELIKGP